MVMMPRPLLALVMCFVLSVCAFATDYYVDPINGDDDNDGLTPGTAFKQPSKAWEAAGDGDRVFMVAGGLDPFEIFEEENSNEDKSVTFSGGWNQDFTVQDTNTPTVVDGGGMDRPLTVENMGMGNIQIEFDNFTFTNGDASDETTAPGKGGGIYSHGVDLTITNSTISGNKAISQYDSNTSPGNAAGGGIYVIGGSVTIQNSSIQGNFAAFVDFSDPGSDPNGSITSFPGFGGGIYHENDDMSGFHDLTITDSTISGNTAQNSTQGGGVFSIDGCGGGIFSHQAPTALTDPPASILIQNLTVSSNVANSSIGGNGFGGGIYLRRGGSGNFIGGAIDVTTSTIENNLASSGDGLTSFGTGGLGGGLFLEGDRGPSVTITDSVFTGNGGNQGSSTAFGTGGAIATDNAGFLQVVDCHFVENFGCNGSFDGRGGALDLIGTAASLLRCIFDTNMALLPPESVPGTYFGDGGCVFFRSFDSFDSFRVDTCGFANNTAVCEPDNLLRGATYQGRGEVFFLDRPNPSSRETARGIFTNIFFANMIANTIVSDTPSSDAAFYTQKGRLALYNTLVSGYDSVVENETGFGFFTNSLAEGNTTLVSGLNTENYDTTTDPNFSQANADLTFDEVDGIYKIGSNSDAIDAGLELFIPVEPDDEPRLDIIGVARPRGDGYDIGYFESAFSASGVTLPQVISQVLGGGGSGADANNDNLVDAADAQTVINSN